MGLDFIREKGEKFTQLRDRSKEQELDMQDLLADTKADHIIRHFQCQLSDLEAEIIPGLALIARAFSETDVQILQRGKLVATMLAQDAELFTSLMKKNNHTGGMLAVTITGEPSFDGVFPVKPKTSFKKD